VVPRRGPGGGGGVRSDATGGSVGVPTAKDVCGAERAMELAAVLHRSSS
jgi:hypothetical protein